MSGEIVSEWVAKAEEDWTALARLQAGGMADVANTIVFHAQQCAEKYLKALIQRGHWARRSHSRGGSQRSRLRRRPAGHPLN